jgi:UPF0716 protein FxsA
MPIIALLFLALPIIELIVIVYAAQAIGTPQALVLLVAMSIVGAWLVKVEGLGVWRRLQATLARGEIPHREVVDGALILVAGAFLLTPGFVTDAVGLLFLAPPTRAVIRTALIARSKSGRILTVFAAPAAARRRPGTTGRVHDVDAWDATWDRDDDPRDTPPGLPR